MKQQTIEKKDKIIIQNWGETEFILFPGTKSTKPYLYFKYLNPETGINERVRKIAGLKQGAPLTTLKKNAKILSDTLIELMSTGWNPHTEQTVDAPLTTLSGMRDCVDGYIKHLDDKLANGVINDKTYQNITKLFDWFKEWLKSKQYAMRKPSTFTDIDIDAFMQKYAKDRVWLKSSYNTYRGHLTTFFNYLRKLKVISENPVTFADKKNTKNDVSRFKIFEVDELSTVVELLRKDKDFLDLYLAAKIIYHYNIRPVEITRIRIRDVDFDKNHLYLDYTKTKNKQDATWEFTNADIKLLKRLIKDAPGDYFVFGGRNKPQSVQVCKDFFGQKWRAFRRKYDIKPHLKLYALKHSADYYDLESGINIIEISKRNRHSSPNVTNTYVKERLNKKTIKPSGNKMF